MRKASGWMRALITWCTAVVALGLLALAECLP